MPYKISCWVVPVNTRGPWDKQMRPGAGVYLVAAKNEGQALRSVRAAVHARGATTLSTTHAWVTDDWALPENGRVYELSPEDFERCGETKGCGHHLPLDPANYINDAKEIHHVRDPRRPAKPRARCR